MDPIDPHNFSEVNFQMKKTTTTKNKHKEGKIKKRNNSLKDQGQPHTMRAEIFFLGSTSLTCD